MWWASRLCSEILNRTTLLCKGYIIFGMKLRQSENLVYILKSLKIKTTNFTKWIFCWRNENCIFSNGFVCLYLMIYWEWFRNHTLQILRIYAFVFIYARFFLRSLCTTRDLDERKSCINFLIHLCSQFALDENAIREFTEL